MNWIINYLRTDLGNEQRTAVKKAKIGGWPDWLTDLLTNWLTDWLPYRLVSWLSCPHNAFNIHNRYGLISKLTPGFQACFIVTSRSFAKFCQNLLNWTIKSFDLFSNYLTLVCARRILQNLPHFRSLLYRLTIDERASLKEEPFRNRQSELLTSVYSYRNIIV